MKRSIFFIGMRVLQILKVIYSFAINFGILDFRPSALADVTANVNHIDGVSHVDLAFMHVVKHLFGAFGPDLVISGMSEKTDTDDDIAFEGKALLRFEELLLETRTAAKGYDVVFADHIISLQYYLHNACAIFPFSPDPAVLKRKSGRPIVSRTESLIRSRCPCADSLL